MTQTLTAAPSLVRLYAKAAVTAPLHVFSKDGGDTLPETVLELAPQSIDQNHLAAYDRVCGFRFGDTLSPTYLHVLAFPLQVALMTERAFPFPLVGLVHVANAITVHRPVGVGEQVSFTVRADNLRPHAAGRQLDLLSEASVDGETVWSGRSTYLRRSGGPPAKKGVAGGGGNPERPVGERKPKEAAPPPPVPSVGAAQLRVPGDIGRRYGAVSGDRNPIHLSGLSAKAFGFPSAIAHGMWLKARTLATLEGRLPEAYTVEVAFKLPVLLPSTLAVTSTPSGSGWDLEVRSARSGKPHLAGIITSA